MERIRTGSSWSGGDRKSTRLNSSHLGISYAVFCLKKKHVDQLPDGGGPRSQHPDDTAITHFQAVAGRVPKLVQLEASRAAGDFAAMPKKETLSHDRELDNLDRNLGGLR